MGGFVENGRDNGGVGLDDLVYPRGNSNSMGLETDEEESVSKCLLYLEVRY